MKELLLVLAIVGMAALLYENQKLRHARDRDADRMSQMQQKTEELQRESNKLEREAQELRDKIPSPKPIAQATPPPSWFHQRLKERPDALEQPAYNQTYVLPPSGTYYIDKYGRRYRYNASGQAVYQ